MKIDEIIARFSEDEATERLITGLQTLDKPRLHLVGLRGSAQTLIASQVIPRAKGVHVFVLNEKEEAAYFLNDLETLLPDNRAVFFPTSSRLPYQESRTDNTNVLLRAETLEAIGQERDFLAVVTYPEALSEKVVTQKHLKSNTLIINQGEQLSLDFLNELLFEYEFERVDFVTGPGQFSIRGGIVDIYSFANDHPFRVELFGDEVDSLRTFDPATQLSVKNHGRITVVPNLQEKLRREFRESFFEFLPEGSTLWMDNIALTVDKVDEVFNQATKAYEKLESNVVRLAPDQMFIPGPFLQETFSRHSVLETGSSAILPNTDRIEYDQSPQPEFRKNFELLAKNLNENEAKGIKNIIAATSSNQIERLYNIYEDLQLKVNFTPVLFPLHAGFIDKRLKLAVYTDHQIFERFQRFHLKEGFREKQKAITLKELTDLQPGDYVTHIDHGVGQFAGLQKIENNGKEQEVIRLVYRDSDMLYVSIHSLHRISKFVGKEGTAPKVNKLGSNAWSSLKQKTKKKVKEIAYDLIQLYAKRKAQQGFAFAPDTYLQHELEASFLYEDTPDQLTTTEAVKKDMEITTPMDRLVCGDVGFGKTEIAIRAAFKAVTDSKQVAILVPTTILALQHYKTFKKRLEGFPCNIDYINRFKTAKQQKETLRKLAEGQLDIVIGTHRIVGKDVKFKDLGLMIIDEEQKFGVAVKDKLKTIKVNVDTLTLTATPIPRTLQFSLMGARDLSIITTPPPNRQPVETQLYTFNEEIIRDAIDYEISRSGQVFFVHNRVQNIGEISAMIKRLVPGARVAIAHGQMDGNDLESVMMGFIEQDFDVLVATTIIESGLDISNANTIIINQAHNFGLSDLHQMRGRVGRSNKKAFCVLLAPPLATVSNESRRRLQAIEQFSDLGSGFNIAMRDLDIRGAGNLLGGEQSGFISEIGFDMYHKILEEAVHELKEEKFGELFPEEQEAHQFVKDCQLETDLEIMIPDDYINNITERLSLYQKLASIDNDRDLDRFEDELVDRFGPVPSVTMRLLETLRLRWVAREIGFEKLVLKRQRLIGYFVQNQESPYYQSPAFNRVLNFVKNHPREVNMKEKNNKLTLSFDGVRSVAQALKLIQPIVGDLAEA